MKNNFSQRDIVLVNIPYSNDLGLKYRPVLILSNNNYNEFCEDYSVANISSTANDNKYNLDLLSKDIVEGELKLKSKVKTDHLRLIEQARVVKKIAKISDPLFVKIKDKINELIL